MLAHHPTTGQPIRILRTSANVYAEEKTLVWVQSPFEIPKDITKRWYTVISEPEACHHVNLSAVCAVMLDARADVNAWLSVLPTIFHHSSSDTLLVAPNRIVDALAARGFTTDRALVLEDMYDMYPFLGEPLTAEDPAEKVFLSIAHVLHMNRIVWGAGTDRDALPFSVRAQFDAWKRCLHGSVASMRIPKLWLIQQFYQPSSHRRLKEITSCLQKNVENPHIDHIVLLNEQHYSSLEGMSKVTQTVISHRLTYYDVLKTIQEKVPHGDYVVFANSDIYFDDSLKHLWRIPMVSKRLFLALLRWEDSGQIFGPRSDSQDAWILARDTVDFDVDQEEFGFPFGKSGCDNALALLMLKKRCIVTNPAYTIKSHHVHSSGVRTYDPKDILYKTHYLYVDPTPIYPYTIVNDLKAVAAPPSTVNMLWNSNRLGRSFARPIIAVNDADVKTVCTMLRHKEDTYHIMDNNDNLWTPSPSAATLYNFRGGVFVDLQGLVYDFQNLYVGPHPLWKSAWESSSVSALTSTIHVPHLIVVPLAAECKQSLSTWVLNYLPRALHIRNIVSQAGLGTPEFLVPQISEIGSFLHDCVWETSDGRGNITVSPIVDNMSYFSKNVWAMPPEADSAFVTSEDIAVLRSLIPPPKTQDETPTVVFCVEDDDEEVCTRYMAEEVADKLFHKGWRVIYSSKHDNASVRRTAFQQASWLIGSGSALDWMWYCRPGTTVVEIMRNWEPRADHVHLAGASGLRYVLCAVKREPIQLQRQHAHMEIGLALRKFGFKDILKTKIVGEKPTIIVPYGAALDGIWNHSGDTFREMVELWEERGYVRVEKSEDTGYCWWGRIGETLLYDRPTARWWNEKTPYQMALFGNCVPPGPGAHSLRQSVWGFWPRSPRAVEALATTSKNMLGYDARTIQSLFLGKIENGVQMKARTERDWSKCVELFSMPVDSTGKPYPYTQDMYLDKLCHARFGLCLPGFGPKCNREIEYFACGCVPIVTPGVDMTGYLVPPKQGVHYFRVDLPEQVDKIVKETPPEVWAAMSAACREWWRTYASAEGFFRLTWARIEQCRPFINVGIPKKFLV